MKRFFAILLFLLLVITTFSVKAEVLTPAGIEQAVLIQDVAPAADVINTVVDFTAIVPVEKGTFNYYFNYGLANYVDEFVVVATIDKVQTYKRSIEIRSLIIRQNQTRFNAKPQFINSPEVVSRSGLIARMSINNLSKQTLLLNNKANLIRAISI